MNTVSVIVAGHTYAISWLAGVMGDRCDALRAAGRLIASPDINQHLAGLYLINKIQNTREPEMEGVSQ